MSNQNDFVIDNGTGLAVRQDIEDALQALAGNSSGSSEPSVKYSYQWWADTNAAVMKLRNSANDGWIEIFQLDGTLTLEDGSNSAPALSFRDDLDTGVFSSASDNFNVATGGVERINVGSTIMIINDGGVDYDVRIEGDTKPNLVYVDAGNDRVGIGDRSDPAKLLDVGVSDGSTVEQYLRNNTINLLSKISGTSNAQFGTETSHNLNLLTSNTIRATIDTSGNLTISDGDLVVGTAGHGISFINQADTASGETVASSVLDEYEEGSFDVNYKTGSAGGNTVSSASYASTGGLYTKIGDMVHFQIRINCSSSNALGGQIVIEGLPFTHKSTTIASGAYIVIGDMLGSTVARLHIDGTEIRFLTASGSSFGSGAGGVNLNTQFHCAGTYKAT